MSFYTSLNGLKNAQTELSVISNNLANAETTGFKKSRINFADIVAGSASANPKLVKGIGSTVQSVDQNFSLGPIQQTGLQEILPEFVQRVLALAGVQVLALGEVLVDADRPIGLAAPPEQVAQREMQLDRLRVDLGDFEEGIDGLVRLLVEQEIQALKIGAWQRTGLMHHLAHVHPRRRPAGPGPRSGRALVGGHE